MKVFRKFPYLYLLAIPLLLILLGTASNQAVLIANHGKFPVMLNEAQYSHFCSAPEDEEMKFSVTDSSISPMSCTEGGQFIDDVHSVMGKNSHLKALSDIFNLKVAIYSIGDFLLMLGYWLLSFSWISYITLVVRRLATLIE